VPVFRMNGYLWILLDSAKSIVTLNNKVFPIIEYYLTELELRTLYRRMGHPLITRLEKILYRTDYNWDSTILRKIEEFYYYY
jgi:hypothetical protein